MNIHGKTKIKGRIPDTKEEHYKEPKEISYDIKSWMTATNESE